MTFDDYVRVYWPSIVLGALCAYAADYLVRSIAGRTLGIIVGLLIAVLVGTLVAKVRAKWAERELKEVRAKWGKSE
jgi:hypothetical protein